MYAENVCGYAPISRPFASLCSILVCKAKDIKAKRYLPIDIKISSQRTRCKLHALYTIQQQPPGKIFPKKNAQKC